MSASTLPDLPFGVSANLTHLYAIAPQDAVAAELARLLTLMDETDQAALTAFVKSLVTNAVLYDLRLWNGRLALESATGSARPRGHGVLGAQTLVTTVVRADALNPSASILAIRRKSLRPFYRGRRTIGVAMIGPAHTTHD
jgi:hypothetical protein